MITASYLSYELGLHSEKRSMETWILLENRQKEDGVFHTNEPEILIV